MTALTTKTDNLPAAKIVLDGCSPALKELLDNSGDYTWSVSEMPRRPAVHAEARAVLAQLEEINAPAKGAEIIGALAPLVALYGVQDKSEAEWTAFWKVYVEDLETYPLWAIEAACKRYRRRSDSQWFPRPGPLLDLCADEYRRSCMAMSRLRRGLANCHQAAA